MHVSVCVTCRDECSASSPADPVVPVGLVDPAVPAALYHHANNRSLVQGERTFTIVRSKA